MCGRQPVTHSEATTRPIPRTATTPAVYTPAMDEGCSYLSELVRINDTLNWSDARRESYLAAVEILRTTLGARLAPTYLLESTGTRLELVADGDDEAFLSEEYATLSAAGHVRSPWVNPQEWPVSAADHLDDESWIAQPDSFKEWFGEWGVVVPLHADGRHLGAVLLCFDSEFVLRSPEDEFLAAAGRILGSALYRWQVLDRERELGALEERRRLSDELHDDLSQRAAGIGLNVAAIRLDVEKGAEIGGALARLDDAVMDLRRSLRHEMLGLRADAQLVDGSFTAQVRTHLEHFEQELGIPTAFECPDPDGVDAVPLPLAAQLLRVLQESLSNAHLHAAASHVTVRLLSARTRVRLEVEDDGNGFDPETVPDSRLGLSIMRERMEQVDGSLHIGHSDGGGTVVVADAPLTGEWLGAFPVGRGA